MKTQAAYMFNEYSGSGIPTNFLDWSPNSFPLDTNSGVIVSSINADGYDTVFGSSASLSYLTSSTFALSGVPGFSVALKLKSSVATGFPYALVRLPGVFNVGITAAGKAFFTVEQSSVPTTISGSVYILDGNYHSILCTVNSGSLNIYVDGVLDASSSYSFSTPDAPTGILIMGAETTTSSSWFTGNLNYCIIYNSTLTLLDAVNLAVATQKGINITGPHSFSAGDLVGNANLSSQGVVTWVTDSNNFSVLPYSSFNALNIFKYGNIYNSLRQNFMEMDNDFDGNGNGQIRIKKGINSFAALGSAPVITLDYTGEQGQVISGNISGTPSNTTTPVSWLKVLIGGTEYWLPLFQ